MSQKPFEKNICDKYAYSAYTIKILFCTGKKATWNSGLRYVWHGRRLVRSGNIRHSLLHVGSVFSWIAEKEPNKMAVRDAGQD
jgi:hypothetical protein